MFCYEKVMRLKDESRLRLCIKLVDSQEPQWSVAAHICQKGKRTWASLQGFNDYTWRRLTGDKREVYTLTQIRLLISDDELLAAVEEAYAAIAPKPKNIRGWV